MFIKFDVYRLNILSIFINIYHFRLKSDVLSHLSTSISLDESNFHCNISQIIINVIYNDEEIYIAIYPPENFPDVISYLRERN